MMFLNCVRCKRCQPRHKTNHFVHECENAKERMMAQMEKPKYLKWIVEEKGVDFEDHQQGEKLKCYRLSYNKDEEILDDWALHIRRHYEWDPDLKESADSNNMSVEDYLREYVLPEKTEKDDPDPRGSPTRSADLTEILVSDMLEFIYNFRVPRIKQLGRFDQNGSLPGTDVIAYKFAKNLKNPSDEDVLVAVEVKALLRCSTKAGAAHTIDKAVQGSKLDEHRFGHTLNRLRFWCSKLQMVEKAHELARFQVRTEHPYKLWFGGAAVTSLPDITGKVIAGVRGKDLELRTDQFVFYIHGKDLMELTHDIYERCTK